MKLAHFFAFVVCLALIGCKGGGAAGKYYMNVQKKDLMPGADKIVLELKSDGTFQASAGPLTIVSGDWKEDGGKVTFSEGQGLIGKVYTVTGDKLVPEGQPGWDWTRK